MMGGVRTREMNMMEAALLTALDWDTHVEQAPAAGGGGEACKEHGQEHVKMPMEEGAEE
eukprot:gene12128-11219_t